MTTTDAPVEPTPADPAATTPAGRTPGFVLAVTLAVVLGLLAAVLAVLLAADGDGGDAAADLRRSAGQVGEALLTYDHQDPQAHRNAVLALATGSFRSEYEEAFDQGLGELITKTQAQSEGFVKDVYVADIGEDSAEAIIVADVERDGAGGPRTLYDIYILLTFVRVDGAWKVDQVTDLNFAAEGAAGAEPTSTTSSSIPVP